MRRELRRRKSPEIQSHIDTHETAVKPKTETKRQTEASARHTEETSENPINGKTLHKGPVAHVVVT